MNEHSCGPIMKTRCQEVCACKENILVHKNSRSGLHLILLLFFKLNFKAIVKLSSTLSRKKGDMAQIIFEQIKF